MLLNLLDDKRMKDFVRTYVQNFSESYKVKFKKIFCVSVSSHGLSLLRNVPATDQPESDSMAIRLTVPAGYKLLKIS